MSGQNTGLDRVAHVAHVVQPTVMPFARGIEVHAPNFNRCRLDAVAQPKIAAAVLRLQIVTVGFGAQRIAQDCDNFQLIGYRASRGQG